MNDCPRCQILEESLRVRDRQIWELRRELDHRDTVAAPPLREEQPTLNDLPRPSQAPCGCGAPILCLEEALPIDSQEGP